MKQQLLFFLLACGILSNAQVFSENFNGGSMPSGWTVNNPDTTYNWGVGSQAGFVIFPSGAAFFDDDDAGPSSINSNARLVSPVINLVGVTSPKLSFKYANMIYDLDSTIKVEVFNGTSWIQVFSSVGDSGQWGIDWNTFMYTIEAYDNATNIDLTPYINANFQLRFVYDDAGDYSYGAAIDDVTITSASLATSEVSAEDKLQIYPNPVRDNLYIKSDLKSNSKVSVIDMSGKFVKTFTGAAESYNLSDLPRGTYMIVIDDGENVIKKKIIKQ
ncbi:T9SS type A sorting domain-containing protein [Chryseobacterium sp. RG1]|uniref:T9SS type A sorting domain-containing protein n=1 Tax=Chryseobacterium tagetis TaxID=2801334 RepID=A0ABS7ZZ28_9FLAO|nr:T9SS type A sorting domain-containing protein [Chryseobacterium tagetis]MCA6066979.1 T9SS type A sorting domain-containing protein [Chryseobacterium tagetis]